MKLQLLTDNVTWLPKKLNEPIPPPAPRPRMNEPPPVLLLPPSASLWSNVLFVTVANPSFSTAPPTLWPTRELLVKPLAWEPPIARLDENAQPSTVRMLPSSFATAPPLAMSTT